MAKTALVTGANRGIGLEAVKQLAEAGFLVFLSARNKSAGQQAAQALKETGKSVEFLAIDVAESASVHEAAAALARTINQLDVLVNNAGILLDEEGSVLDVEDTKLRQTLETNTLGPLRVTQAFLPLLLKSRQARVINVSSGAGSLAEMSTYAPAYSISKAALNAVTKQLAGALKDRGISVNSMCPGWVRTDMGGAGAPRSVEKGADTIVWLATQAPAHLTGQFLRDRKSIPW